MLIIQLQRDSENPINQCEYLSINPEGRGGETIDDILKDANNSGETDHMNYKNSKSEEYKTMRLFLFYMKGWFGNDKQLNKAFQNNYENNTDNIE